MTIAVGDRLPEAGLFILGEQGPEAVSTASLFGGKKAVLFAVPGAFTPTCHNNHAPGFLDAYDAFKAKAVDKIYCVGVNDPFVMNAWENALGLSGKIDVLSDGNGDFTKAIGLSLDGSGFGLGLRSLRYAMLVEDGVVKVLNVEDVPTEATTSSAQGLLDAL